MQYKPHDYQQYAINYILEHPIAAVILGMGLGKTSITLTAIEQLMYGCFEISKVLVVAPLRVARNTWSDEIHKWEHLKHLKYSIVLVQKFLNKWTIFLFCSILFSSNQKEH
ncbi:SNF2 domain protein [[Ruminococcus] lactaris ATCC 29176]|uniref:SNF2 domain protein n=1 Tax=[Ruminococcus] lactaris ATCC 29176 TaxID=471875 RepID=B5CRX4_9FIRM|nr:SNF2-related protein [[Ruminococcus] lactaris]EDY32062.1 SNF2 domain protein [[Ruminococcus] lactaris ATCC 29176]